MRWLNRKNSKAGARDWQCRNRNENARKQFGLSENFYLLPRRPLNMIQVSGVEALLR
jgi:hypothetical protein